jgi:hypothetical protein
MRLMTGRVNTYSDLEGCGRVEDNRLYCQPTSTAARLCIMECDMA